MIKIKIKTHKTLIQEIEVKGHSMSAESGQDLICAGVSCIVMGGYNALNEITNSEFDYKMEDGYFKIVTNRNDLETQTILKTIIIQLETMHRSYAQYIKIEKMEV